MFDWPEPIRTLRGYIPAEMRVLRGAIGLIGGIILGFEIILLMLSGNWHLGYTHERFLASLLGLLVPAAIGIISPLWYWVGRPVWYRIERPGLTVVHRWRDARFLPGLAGAVIGGSLFFPVSATSRFWVQTLVPFGLLVGFASPVWFWIVRPGAGQWIDTTLPSGFSPASFRKKSVRLLAVVGVLFVTSMAVTAMIALPVVSIGDPTRSNGVSVAITDVRTTTEVTERGGMTVEAAHNWQLLLVRLTVENEGETRRPLPGRTVGDIAVIAPECIANNFGEPTNNCNQVHLDGNFSTNGEDYTTYNVRYESVDGMIAPGQRLSGWLVFRLENPPSNESSFDAMVIVDGVGRWKIESSA